MKFLQTLSIILLTLSFAVKANAFSDRDAAFTAMSKKKWSDAIKYAQKSGDKTTLKIIQAKKFLDIGGDFEEIIQFIAQNPHWPEIDKITKVAENAITTETSKTKIVRWFKDKNTLTDHGAKYYALAAEKLIKDPTKLGHVIREGWIYGDFTKDEQKAFLAKHGKQFSKDDHVKKIDYLLWAGADISTPSYHVTTRNKTTQHSALCGLHGEDINDLLKIVDQNTRRIFKVTMSLMRFDKNAEEIFKNLDENKRHHSVLLYSYLKLHEKDDIISDRLAKLIIQAPIDHDHGAEWWKLKARYARNLIKQHKYQAAYDIAKNHHATASEDVSEAEFMAGWLALRFLNKPSVAARHFQVMHHVVKQPISLSRAAYWLGRTELVLGQKDAAHKWFREAAAFNYTFYGQLASLELGNHAITLPKQPKISDCHHRDIAQNEIARAAKLLLAYDFNDLAMIYVKAFMTQAQNSEEALIMMDYIRSRKKTPDIISMAKAASYNKILLVNDAFPTKYKINNKFIEPALAYAIIRQETLFDQHAISHRNAHGLMQLVPKTACETAKSLKIRCKPNKHLLSDPEYNIMLGTKEFKNNIDANNGSYILSIIAYNAGPHKVPEWIETYGDPRLLKNRYAIIDWIEKIPYYETRNYVQRVLENLQVYRAILGLGKELRLLKDIGL